MESPSSFEVSPANLEGAAYVLDDSPNLGSNRPNDEEYPVRPPSRLGFNPPSLSSASFEASSNSEAVWWSHSLFQGVDIPDLRLSSLKSSTKMDYLSNSQSFTPLRDNSPDLSYGMASDHNNSPVSPRKSPPPVSRLCFPFVTTPSPRRNKPPTQTQSSRHKYTCFPSLMSPASAGRSSAKHQRHNYAQHGYSRTALQHVKWFWSIREEDLERPKTDLESAIQTSSSSLARTTPSSSQDLPPITVHPRFGDIEALRDPHCSHIDRSFVSIPTWTIRKSLWMFDLHRITENSNNRQTASDEDDDDESINDLEASISTNFSDDSDTTLVESELNLPQTVNTSTAHITSKLDTQVQLTLPYSKVSRSPSKRLKIRTMKRTKTSGVNSDHNRPINWYHRWELLLELSRGRKRCCVQPSMSHLLPSEDSCGLATSLEDLISKDNQFKLWD